MKARLGQNFLYSADWQRRVADAVAPAADDLILEIGGGPGHISALLANRAGRLLVVELDPRLARELEHRFAQPHVRVLHADILELNLKELLDDELKASELRRARIFGNLPYYITSPILLHLFTAAHLVYDAVIMVQREVADRILATPGNSAFGLLSATVQFYTQPALLFTLPPGAFRPAPKVSSSLLRLAFHSRAAELAVDERDFMRFLRLAFAQKRKKLVNNLKTHFPRDAVARAFDQLSLSPSTRAEELSVEQLAGVLSSLRAQLTQAT